MKFYLTTTIMASDNNNVLQPSREGDLQALYHCYLESIVLTLLLLFFFSTNVPLYSVCLEMIWRSNSSQADIREQQW